MALSGFQLPAISARSRRLRGLPAIPAATVSASTAASFRLFPPARARRRRAASTAEGMPRIVYCMTEDRWRLQRLQADGTATAADPQRTDMRTNIDVDDYLK